MATLKITYFIREEALPYSDVLKYLLGLVSQRFVVDFEETAIEAEAGIRFGCHNDDYIIVGDIYAALLQKVPCAPEYYRQLLIYRDAGDEVPDYLASIFSFLHCLGESLTGNTRDRFDRLTYGGSLYSRYYDSYADVVTPLMRQFLYDVCGCEEVVVRREKKVLLTHDVDLLNSGLKQELRYFFKKPSISLLKALMLHVVGVRKLWGDIESIIRLERKYGVRSVFYLLPETGEYEGINNADYSLNTLNKVAQRIAEYGWKIGLHRGTSLATYDEQKSLISVPVTSNRNHFLKYRLPDDWEEIGREGLMSDMGLGWSDRPGLRNGYPFPFKPFGCQLEAVPMVLMDTVFDRANNPEGTVEAFMTMTSRWKDGYHVSILFHNNYLTPWSNHRFLKAYRNILELIREECDVLIKQ